MNENTLYFGFSRKPPRFDEMRVFESETLQFCGVDFTFNIIGYSHYIEAPGIDYYELCSCRHPAEDGDPEAQFTFPLDTGTSLNLGAALGEVDVETKVETGPLAMFPEDDDFDLVHEFSDDAYTTIKLLPDENAYETYHTYPEIDLTVYTRNTLTV